MRKILLGLGAVASMAAPAIAVVSCGQKTTDTKTKTGLKVEIKPVAKKQIDVTEELGKRLIEDRNTLLNILKHDSMPELVNTIIKLTTDIETENDLDLTFTEEFNREDETSVTLAATKMMPIIKKAFDYLSDVKSIGSYVGIISNMVTVDVVKHFISEKYVSAGLMHLLSDTVLPLANAFAKSTPSELNALIMGFVPFAKDEMESTSISAEQTGAGWIFKSGTHKTTGNMISGLASSLGARKRTAVVSHEKFAVKDLMNILKDDIVTLTVSGLVQMISNSTDLMALIKNTANAYNNAIIHDQNVDNPLSRQENEIMSFGLKFSGHKFTVNEKEYKETNGLIDWYINGNELVDKDGKLLARKTGEMNSEKIEFLVSELPLKDNVIGSHIIKNDIFGTPEDAAKAVTSISIKELAMEMQVQDIFDTISGSFNLVVPLSMWGINIMNGQTNLVQNIDGAHRIAEILHDEKLMQAFAAILTPPEGATSEMVAAKVGQSMATAMPGFIGLIAEVLGMS